MLSPNVYMWRSEPLLVDVKSPSLLSERNRCLFPAIAFSALDIGYRLDHAIDSSPKRRRCSEPLTLVLVVQNSHP
jgi:hypothetical protein